MNSRGMLIGSLTTSPLMYGRQILTNLVNICYPPAVLLTTLQTIILAPGKNSQLPGSTGSKLSCMLIGLASMLFTNTLSRAQQPVLLAVVESLVVLADCCHLRQMSVCLASAGSRTTTVDTVPVDVSLTTSHMATCASLRIVDG